MMLFILLSLVVLCAATALDFAYVSHTQAVQAARESTTAHERARHANLASTWSVAVNLIGSVGIFAVLGYSWWLILPEFVGLWIGCQIAIRRLPLMHPDPGISDGVKG